MNITTQTKTAAQINQRHHSGALGFNSPGNRVVSNMVGQHSQKLKQHANAAQFGVTDFINIADVKPAITRIRLVMHDACVLWVESLGNSLDPLLANRLGQKEVYFWKRTQGGISNV
jgi:phosphotransferase system IIB component